MKNKAQAIEAIQNDCQIRHAYYVNGETCAIAGLVLAADPTIDLKTIVNLPANEHAIAWQWPMEGDEGPEDTLFMRALLIKHFSFRAIDLAVIQNLNDRFEDPEIRRAEIISYIETIEED